MLQLFDFICGIPYVLVVVVFMVLFFLFMFALVFGSGSSSSGYSGGGYTSNGNSNSTYSKKTPYRRYDDGRVEMGFEFGNGDVYYSGSENYNRKISDSQYLDTKSCTASSGDLNGGSHNFEQGYTDYYLDI